MTKKRLRDKGRRTNTREATRLRKLDILGEELDGGVADLLGVVIRVAGDSERADRGQQPPEPASGDPLYEFNADSLQNVFSRAHRDTLHHYSLAHACHQIADRLRSGVPE